MRHESSTWRKMVSIVAGGPEEEERRKRAARNDDVQVTYLVSFSRCGSASTLFCWFLDKS